MSLLRRVATLVGGAEVVTVLVADDGPDLEELEAPGRELRVHRYRHDDVALHDALSTQGRADVVVDLALGRATARRLPMLLTHTRRGGRLVVAVPPGPEARARLTALVDDVRRLQRQGPRPPSPGRDRRAPVEREAHALADSVADLDLDRGLLVVRHGVETWSVVPEVRFDATLEAAAQLGRVVHRRPAASRTTTAPFRTSEPDDAPVRTLDAPPLSLRSFEDVVVTPRNVAHTRDLVLPQAFRDTTRRRPVTPVLAEWTRWAVRVPDGLGADGPPPEPLRGTWFHGDSFLRGHFGHALTEQVSHLWAWPEVLARHPEAGVLVTAAEKPVASWELDLLEAAGVPRDRVHATPVPVRVDRLLAATPGYVVLGHVHPSLRDLYASVGDALEARSGLGTTPRRVFVTRSGAKRRCHEAAEVEALFVRHGFTVVTPEQHPLPDQVAMVRGADAIAGYGGSNLFHLLLGGAPRPVVVVSHTRYHSWNEKAMAALWDHPLTLARGVPDVVTRGFSKRSMHSDYHLDLAGAGRVLVAALEALG